ncbi:MAG: hypothetical protein ABIJ46_05270 [bacterium]
MPRPDDQNQGQERSWARELERNRLRSPLSGGLRLPGPGAAAGDDFAGGGEADDDQQPTGGKAAGAGSATPSSAETAKMLGQAISGAGLTKLAADEAKKVAEEAAGGGLIGAAKAAWGLANKWLPWLLLFGAYTLLFEEPFITVPSLILLTWIWVALAHWLHISWIRKFNVLEWLALITISGLYLAALSVVVVAIIAAATILADPVIQAGMIVT